jgi:hypothetical protein
MVFAPSARAEVMGDARAQATTRVNVSHAGSPHFVPVRIYSETPGLSYTLERDGDRAVVARCPTECVMFVPPGKYQLHVSDTLNTKGGRRGVRIDGPSEIVVDPPAQNKRWLGLGIAIGGHVVIIVGAVVVLSNICISEGESCSRGGVAAGLGMMVGGLAMIPIGFVTFGRGFRPKVEVGPLRAATAAPDPRRVFVGVAPLPSGAGLQAALRF